MAVVIGLSVASLAHAQSANSNRYADRPEAMQFVDQLAHQQGWDSAWTRTMIGNTRFIPTVQRLVRPAANTSESPMRKNWAVYRSRFVEPIRIRAGVKFWREHRRTLERAQREFGVPAEIIVGIIGVESIFGRDTGSFPVLDTLATLAFDFPQDHPRAAQRQSFFQGELSAYLQLLQDNSSGKRRDRLSANTQGSYAGAMGQPQFMPSSWQRHALDYDGDGRIDLQSSADDVIGSVAKYFVDYGYKSGLPIYYTARVESSADDLRTLLAPDIKTTFTAEQMRGMGIRFSDPLAEQHNPQKGLLALVMLENGEREPTYIIGTDNFYALTRYNWSSYYALAVAQLGAAIAAKVQ